MQACSASTLTTKGNTMTRSSNRTITVQQSVSIAACPHVVWDHAHAWTGRSQRTPTIIRPFNLQPQPEIFVRAEVSHQSFTLRYKQIQPKKHTDKAIGPCKLCWLGHGGAWAYREIDTGTRWTQTNTVTIYGKWRGLFLAPMVRWLLKRNTKRVMQQIKKSLEEGKSTTLPLSPTLEGSALSHKQCQRRKDVR